VSSVELEILNFLKKSLGVIIKKMEEDGVVALPVFVDHRFLPEVVISDTGLELRLPGLIYKIKNIGDVPFYLNIGRPITDTEYTVVFPGTYHIIPRSSGRVFLKAPKGYTAKARIEVLR
jgi:hypothetical protein